MSEINKYLQNNKEKIKVRQKKYIENHKDEIRKSNNKYISERRKLDINFRLRGNLRSRLLNAVKRKKSGHTLHLIGCSIEYLKAHLESLMKDGMTWDNYGKNGWSIDHIRPCASFDLSDPIQQNECFHYSNLQPLWNKDNYIKNSIYNGKRYRF